MGKEIPKQNTIYRTKRDQFVFCMSANQWIFEKRDNQNNLMGYNLQFTCNPVMIVDGVLLQKNKGCIANKYIPKIEVARGENGFDSNREDYNTIDKIFQMGLN